MSLQTTTEFHMTGYKRYWLVAKIRARLAQRVAYGSDNPTRKTPDNIPNPATTFRCLRSICVLNTTINYLVGVMTHTLGSTYSPEQIQKNIVAKIFEH